MILTLEVLGQHASRLGAAGRMVFSGRGGTIGRLSDNDWVLPDPYVSGKHARIRFVAGQFLLEDTSSNGVFLNSPQNRLPRNQSHVLQNGDRFFIDAYEIRATLSAPQEQADPFAQSRMPSRSSPYLPAASLQDDPFVGLGGSDPMIAGAESDPLKLLGLESPEPQPIIAPRMDDLNRASPMSQHYRPPKAIPVNTPEWNEPPATPGASAGLIPDDYDPFATTDPAIVAPARTTALPPPTPPPLPVAQRNVSTSERPAPIMSSGTAKLAPGRPVPRAAAPPVPPDARRPEAVAPAADERPAVTTADTSIRQAGIPGNDSLLDFAALLAAAGVEGVQPTPELAKNFGQILRVVVSGLMDVLRARERIKDEFRMHMTTFKTADNNPLKFSANVEDALHNLLVKRNSAYLGPVEAFEDAFADVRNHQMAMLAGLRVAFESMLSEFDPEALQEQFDRQLKKGSLLAAPARLRYWELYRDRFHDMVKDPDANFRDLFGDEFAKAYEEQLQRLKIKRRSDER